MSLLTLHSWLGSPANASAPKPAPASIQAPEPGSQAETESKLRAIDSLIRAKRLGRAIDRAIRDFGLDRSACRAIEVRRLPLETAGGDPVVARTTLDQRVLLDPRRFAFHSARALVSILARELAVCGQHQRLYELAAANDPKLKPVFEKAPDLKVLAELDEDASRALGLAKGSRSGAARSFRARADRLRLSATPAELKQSIHRLAEDVRALDRSLGGLREMEASLQALRLRQLLPAPTDPKAKASPEFAFQYRALLVSTTHYLKQRKLQGAKGDRLCALDGAVPAQVTPRYELACADSVALLAKYLPNVPE